MCVHVAPSLMDISWIQGGDATRDTVKLYGETRVPRQNKKYTALNLRWGLASSRHASLSSCIFCSSDINRNPRVQAFEMHSVLALSLLIALPSSRTRRPSGRRRDRDYATKPIKVRGDLRRPAGVRSKQPSAELARWQLIAGPRPRNRRTCPNLQRGRRGVHWPLEVGVVVIHGRNSDRRSRGRRHAWPASPRRPSHGSPPL